MVEYVLFINLQEFKVGSSRPQNESRQLSKVNLGCPDIGNGTAAKVTQLLMKVATGEAFRNDSGGHGTDTGNPVANL